MDSFTSEISLKVPTQADLRHKPSSLSSTCTDSASQDTEAGEDEDDDEEEEEENGEAGRCTVVVTLDEEEVHPDTALAEAAHSPTAEQENDTKKDRGGSRL